VFGCLYRSRPISNDPGSDSDPMFGWGISRNGSERSCPDATNIPYLSRIKLCGKNERTMPSRMSG
jgi:hypothetical protein